jgi:hypothetical protein
MKDKELMQQAFEGMTGIVDAWTNPALMQARNGFIQGWEAGATAEREAAIEDARTVGGEAGAEIEKLIRARGEE